MTSSSDLTKKIIPRPMRPLIRVSFFFSKKKSMSQSEFETHWRDTHGRLAIASKAFRDADIQQYCQIHNSKDLNKEAVKLGLPLVDFEWDACSEMYVRSWEDYVLLATSDEMRDVLGPDGARMMDTERGVRVMVTKVDPLYIKSSL